MAKKKKKKFILIKFIFCLAIILGFLYWYGTYVEPKNLKVQEYKIENENITDNFEGFKIVHISDIHYGRIFALDDLKKLVKKINDLNPDIVVLTGDLVDRDTKMTTSMAKEISEYLSKINAVNGKYAINGNHEVKLDEWENIINNGDFINLNNTYDPIYNGGYNHILIAGVSTFQDKESITNKNQKSINYINSFEKDGPIYKILLMHEPDYVDDLEDNPFDLILAGHSHAGQVRIPFVGAIFTPLGAKKYYDNYYKIEDSELYISNGIGVSNYNIRLFNPPTINVYRLIKSI